MSELHSISMTLLPCGCRVIIAPGTQFDNMHDFCPKHMEFLFGAVMTPYFTNVIKTMLAAHKTFALGVQLPTVTENAANEPTNGH